MDPLRSELPIVQIVKDETVAGIAVIALPVVQDCLIGDFLPPHLNLSNTTTTVAETLIASAQ